MESGGRRRAAPQPEAGAHRAHDLAFRFGLLCRGDGDQRRVRAAGHKRDNDLKPGPLTMPSSTASNPSTANPAGVLLRRWRDMRGKTQLDLSIEAGVSQKHISFVESGRSVPSRQMLLDLAQALDIPLRERNALLIAGGYAPLYSDAKLAALSTLAKALIEKRGRLDDQDMERFLAAGFERAHLLEVIGVIAASTITNYTGSVTKPPVEPAFQAHVWSASRK
jgi:transcriptional regulator with XRE-family HTH domain